MNESNKRNPLLFIFGLAAVFFVIFIVVVVKVMFSLNGPSKKKLFTSKGTSSIGVIELNGVIMDSKKVVDVSERFAEDDDIKGVVVRINSPGGAVAPSQEIYDAFRKLAAKKPLYSSFGSVAASGGYYVAAATKKIFSNPGTMTGSIGVIMPFADMSELYHWAKVKPYNVKSGKFKDMGNPARPMNEEEKKLFQDMINTVLSQFRKAVMTGRHMTMEEVIAVSDGRILSGEQAKAAKLVDVLGGMSDAIDAMAKEVGINGKPELVYGNKKKKFIERLFDDDEPDAESKSIVNELVSKLLIGVFGGANSHSQLPKAMPMFLMPHAAAE